MDAIYDRIFDKFTAEWNTVNTLYNDGKFDELLEQKSSIFLFKADYCIEAESQFDDDIAKQIDELIADKEFDEYDFKVKINRYGEKYIAYKAITPISEEHLYALISSAYSQATGNINLMDFM